MNPKSSIIFFLISLSTTVFFYTTCLWIKPTSIIFLDGCIGLIISSFAIFLLAFKKSNNQKNFKSIFLQAISFFIVGFSSVSTMLSFHTLYIVSLDRSISVYSLSYLRTYYNDKFFKANLLDEIIKKGYFDGKYASERRVKEQLAIDYFEKNDLGELRLTNKAKRFVDTGRILAKLFNLDRKYLWPKEIKTLSN